MCRDPSATSQLDARQWEEVIAGAYERAGYDEVVLTPRSGDLGRDVIARKHGVGSICIFDQMKAYKPGHVVTAAEVREMLGGITGAANVSKGVITTTSTFAPMIDRDAYIRSRVRHLARNAALPGADRADLHPSTGTRPDRGGHQRYPC